ncbi:MAG: tryptophan halogenase family protein [Gammaproteobacteria bacterium]
MSDGTTPKKKILIVGGGTAGWMTAALFVHGWADRADITLLESSTIGTIGVGEGSTPKMRRFFDKLGVPEAEWMPACNASYKCGIRFPDWSTRKGYRSYYHPFFSQADDTTIRAFFQNATLRNRNLDVHAHPDAFFVSNYLAMSRRAPLPGATTSYTTDYAYHFDAGLIGEFLKGYAVSRGVEHVIDTVSEVRRLDNGDLAGVEAGEHGFIEADFFVDCTGFASLLIGKTLGVPFHSYKNLLFNDRAVAMPTAHEADSGLPSETLSTAMKYGWRWKIPLTNRYGNGYVYSSDYIDETQAEHELREQLGMLDDPVEARHLKMRIGRVERCWEHNCLAVGLAQGFVEPLEATALMVVQDTVETFMQRFEQGDFTARFRAEVNDKVNLIFDGVRNYIFMHYKLNSRDDTEYWIANRENSHVPDDVTRILAVWDKGGDLLGELRSQAARLVYSPTSWYCILAGMGRFPRSPKKPKPKIEVADLAAARSFCERLVTHFPDHRATLAAQRHEPPGDGLRAVGERD